MRNFKFFTIGLVGFMLTAYFGDVSFGQVVGNRVSTGMTLGQNAGRGSSMMSHFNRFSTGLDRIIQPITRTSPDPLSVRTKVNMQNTLRGLSGVGRPRTGSRPRNTGLSGLLRSARNTGIIRPVRPTMFNNMMSRRPNMITLGNIPRSRSFSSSRPIRPIRGYVTPFTVKAQELLRPDIQQNRSAVKGGMLSLLSLAKHKTINHQTALTQNLLTIHNPSLSKYPTIFEIGLQIQNKRHAAKSIFSVR